MDKEQMKVICNFIDEIRSPYKEKLAKMKKKLSDSERQNHRLAGDIAKLGGELDAARRIIEKFSKGFQSQDQFNELLGEAEKFLEGTK